MFVSLGTSWDRRKRRLGEFLVTWRFALVLGEIHESIIDGLLGTVRRGRMISIIMMMVVMLMLLISENQ